ncbi:SRPBCC family protein [Maritalea sp.]|jgi:carbon monoxide dehydrogenase subunit G|uniref:SRPBCC family protein n=1 Tax=Maritalea sp. TaxID=2003361 RepID=UPI0039E5B7D8
MSKIFAVEEKIDAPVHVVWAHLTDPQKLALWMPAIQNVHTANGEHTAPENPLCYRAGGKDLFSPVVDYIPLMLIAYRSTRGNFSATYTYQIDISGEGTSITLNASCEAKGLMVLMQPLLKMVIKRADSVQLKILKAVVEAHKPT